MGSDFNGDGRDDILWRRGDDGTFTDWWGTASGGFVESQNDLVGQIPSDWTVWATGNFHGWGYDDILWRHDSGLLGLWSRIPYDGVVQGHLYVQVPTEWTIAGTGDFNGDGSDDILWRHDSGTLTDWLGNGNAEFVENYGVLSQQVPIDWKVAGIGDFNGDGRDDILWRHDNGALTDWLGTANGGMVENYGALSRLVPTDWKVAGTGDFNGDGRDDILWRNNDGTLTDWLGTASGGFIENYGALSRQVPIDWKVAGTGDFNGDGRDDILWRNDNGALTDWLGTASGGFTENYGALSRQVPLGWVVQPNSIGAGWWDY